MGKEKLEQDGLLWWRVELDREGSIKSCEQVEYASTPGRLVRFVQANAKDLACAAAKAWYAKRLAGYKKNSATRRESRKREGKCIRCSRPKQPERLSALLCVRCCQLAAEAEKLRAQSPRPLKTAAEQHQIFLESMARSRRKRVYANISLVGLLERFDAAGPEAFRAWLVERIEAKAKASNGEDAWSAEPLAEAAE